jgi:hypothetical protein
MLLLMKSGIVDKLLKSDGVILYIVRDDIIDKWNIFLIYYMIIVLKKLSSSQILKYYFEIRIGNAALLGKRESFQIIKSFSEKRDRSYKILNFIRDFSSY